MSIAKLCFAVLKAAQEHFRHEASRASSHHALSFEWLVDPYGKFLSTVSIRTDVRGSHRSTYASRHHFACDPPSEGSNIDLVLRDELLFDDEMTKFFAQFEDDARAQGTTLTLKAAD